MFGYDQYGCSSNILSGCDCDALVGVMKIGCENWIMDQCCLNLVYVLNGTSMAY